MTCTGRERLFAVRIDDTIDSVDTHVTEDETDIDHLRLVAENVGDSVLEVDETLCVCWASSNSPALLGRDLASLMGCPVPEIILPEDRAAVGAVHRAVAPGDVAVVRARVNRPDQEIWVEIVSRPVLAAGGLRGVATLRDVTAEVRAHQRSERAEETLHSVVEHLQDFILLSELDGTIAWASPSWKAFKGQEHFPLDDLDADNVAIAMEMIRQAAATGSSTATMVVRDSADHERTVLWRARAVPDAEGRPLAVQSIGRDITEEQRLSEAASRASEQFRLIADNAADVIVRTTLGGIILWVSPSARRELGYDPEDLIGQRVASVMDDSDLLGPSHLDDDPVDGDDVAAGLLHVLATDGSRVWMNYRATPMREASGDITGRLIVLRNAEADVHHRNTLAASEAKFRKVMENAPIGMSIVSPDGTFLEVNDALVGLLRRPREELLRSRWADVTHPDDRQLNRQLHDDVLAGRRASYRMEKRYVAPDGAVIWGDLSVAGITDDEGSLIGTVAQVIDITAQRASRDELRFRAAHDPLTGLPNRATFIDFLSQHMATPLDSAGICVLFADLDHFKEVNDSLGHEAGDELLREIARRLARSVRDSDMVCRLGGDEFVMALPSVAGHAEAELVAAKVLAGLATPFEVAGQRVTPTVSIGIALGRRESNPQLLMAEADIALYESKRAGRNRWTIFDPHLDGMAHRDLSMVNRLRDALEADAFEVWFQPIVDMTTREIVGYEALSRWIDDVDGHIAPSDFIPIAEASGLVIPLGERVMRTVVDVLTEGLVDVPVNVNLSALHVSDIEAMERLRDVIARAPEIAHLIRIEVTETAVPRMSRRAIDLMVQLADTGVRFCLDDFGTGYASITTLRELPISGIKVDGSLIAEIATSRRVLTLANGILAMAEALGIEAVAEHVETDEQEALLLEHGWRLAQGHRYGRPVPLA